MNSWMILSTVLTAKAGTGAWAAERGRGNTGLADPEGMGTILASPGVIGLVPRYELGVGYLFGPDASRTVQAGAVDSMTAPVTLGLSYRRTKSTAEVSGSDIPGWVEIDEDFSNPRSRAVVGASLGKGWYEGRLGLGVGVFYDHDVSRFGGDVGHLDVNAGLASQLAEQVTLAIAMQNLVPYQDRLEPLKLGAGLHWALAPGAEVEVDLKTLFLGEGELSLSGSGGLGVTVAEIVSIRAGFERDTWKTEDRLWAGVGFNSETSRLDYGLGLLVGQQENDAARVWNGLSLRVKL